MSKFAVGDRVEVVDDLTPEGTGQHLIGLKGVVREVGSNHNLRRWAGTDYKYSVETDDHRSILANAEELELYTPVKDVVTDQKEIPIGRLVVVDGLWDSPWKGSEGVVMSGLDRYGFQQVKVTKFGPALVHTRGLGSTYFLNNLKDITEPLMQVPSLDSGSSWVKPKYTGFSVGAAKDVSHYTQGMPEGVQAMDIIRTQGWAEGFALGNALKYLTRAQYKDDVLADLKKAQDYLAEGIKAVEERTK